MPLVPLTLPAAAGVDYLGGDVKYLVATDAVVYDVTNYPTSNLAYRDTLLNTKLTETITELIGYRGSSIVSASDAGHAATLGNLESFLSVSHNADGTLRAAGIPTISWVGEDVKDLDSLAEYNAPEVAAKSNRIRAHSGFLSYQTLQEDVNNIEDGGMYLTGGYLYLYNSSVQVYGYPLAVPNTRVVLPSAPSTGTRQDLLFLEVWKELAHPLKAAVTSATSTAGVPQIVLNSVDLSSTAVAGDFIDCGNGEVYEIVTVTYQSSDTYVSVRTNVVTAITAQAVRLLSGTPKFLRYGSADYNDAAFGPTSTRGTTGASDFRYLGAGIPINKSPRCTDTGVVGIHSSGAWWQLRFRLRVVSDIDPADATVYPNDHTTSRYFAIGKTSGQYILPQGAAAAVSSYDATLAYTTSRDSTSHADYNDDGVYCEQAANAWSLSNGNLPITSEGVCHFAIPIAMIHRRNTSAWSIVNFNGGSGRPDGRTATAVSWGDVVDLRHRALMPGYSAAKVQDETLNALYSAKLNSAWREYMIDPDGNGNYAHSSIYFTRGLRAEGICGGPGLDSSWAAVRAFYCNNGMEASPDGIRTYYSDEAGIQTVLFHVPTFGSDGAYPSTFAAWATSSKTLTLDINGLPMTSSAPGAAPQARFSGMRPIVTWSQANAWLSTNDGIPIQARVSWGAGFDDGGIKTSSGVVNQKTTIVCTPGVTLLAAILSSTVNNGDTVTLPLLGGGTVNGTLVGFSTNSTGNYLVAEFAGAVVPAYGAQNWVIPVAGTSYAVTVGPSGASQIAAYRRVLGFTVTGWAISAASGSPYYVGEGYDLHSGHALIGAAKIYMPYGSGILTSPPYGTSSLLRGRDAIKGVLWYNNSPAQLLPNSGIGFAPLTYFSPDSVGQADSVYTRSTNLAGFVQTSPSIPLWASASVITDVRLIRTDASTLSAFVSYSDLSSVQKIALFQSTDNGVTWAIQNSGNPVLSPNNIAQDANGVRNPCVVKVGSTWHMWYIGIAGSTASICHATSSNLTTWASHANVTPATDSANGSAWWGGDGTNGAWSVGWDSSLNRAMPCVIYDGTTYKMWYGGYSTTSVGAWRILYSTSADGITWAAPTKCVAPELTSTAVLGDVIGTGLIPLSVIKESDGTGKSHYKMFLASMNGAGVGSDTGFRFIGYTISLDGIHYAPTVYPLHRSDRQATCSFSVIKDGNIYKALTMTGNGAALAVLTMQDTSGSGSSVTGVYSTVGPVVPAPLSTDTVVILYDAACRPFDPSWFDGDLTNNTGNIAVEALHVPNRAIKTTLGTGRTPPDVWGWEGITDDFRAGWHLVLPNNYAVGRRALYFVRATEIQSTRVVSELEIRSFDANGMFNENVPYQVRNIPNVGASVSPLRSRLPRAGEVISIASRGYSSSVLVGGDYVATDAAAGVYATAVGPGLIAVPDRINGNTDDMLDFPAYLDRADEIVMLPVLGRKGGETVMLLSAGVYLSKNAYNNGDLPLLTISPQGRPLVK